MKKIMLTITTGMFLLQSCVVYQPVPVTLPEAHVYDGQVKVISNEGNKMIFRKILYEDNVFYGVQRDKNLGYVPLDSSTIAGIFLYDFKDSRGKTNKAVIGTSLGVGAILFVVATIAAISVIILLFSLMLQ